MDTINQVVRRMNTKNKVPLKQILDGTTIVPVHASLFHFFKGKAAKIATVSIGVDHFGLESYITEQTGSNVYCYDPRQKANETYALLQKGLESGEHGKDMPEWIQVLRQRWIDPTKLHFEATLPFTVSGHSLPFQILIFFP